MSSLVGVAAVVCAWLVIDGSGAARHEPARVASAYATVWVPPLHLHGVGQLDTATEPYRFPLGCMGMTMTRQALQVVLRNRTGPCWRYGVFVTAVLRRVDGVWRLTLEATSRSCPRLALPAAVRAQIVVCRR
jgi:hypothetical protein